MLSYLKGKKWGGEEFLEDILKKQNSETGHWSKQSPELKAAVKELKRWQDDAKNIEYEVMRYSVDNNGKTTFVSAKPWDKQVPKKDPSFQNGHQSVDPPNSNAPP